MKAYLKKHSFLFFSIAIYITPFVISFLVYQVYLLIGNNAQLDNIDSGILYKHPSFWLGYLDIILGLILIIGSAFLARSIWDLSNYLWAQWTVSIIAFLALLVFGFSTVAPWFETNSRLHKNRVILTVMNKISNVDTEEIIIRFKHMDKEFNFVGENRDFNIYEIVNISVDTVLRKMELPLNSIKIQNINYFEKSVDNFDGIMVISNNNKNNFYLKDSDNNILGIDLEVIKYNP